MQTFTCCDCGREFSRPTVRGTRPKRCPDCRGGKVQRRFAACPECGAPAYPGRRCSYACTPRTRARRPCPVCGGPRKTGRTCGRQECITARGGAQASPLRLALEDGDSAVVVALLLDRTVSDGNCWLWTGPRDRDGYGTVRAGKGRDMSTHRLMAEAVHGPLHGEPVHHTCARRACINPDHVQPVTHYDNAAEMLARRWYETRIAELEAALSSVDPTNALLVGRVA